MSDCSASLSAQPRRSTRTKKRAAYRDSEDPEIHGGDGDVIERPKRKRKLKKHQENLGPELSQSKSSGRRVRGLLQRLKEFPLDVVFIVSVPKQKISIGLNRFDRFLNALRHKIFSIWPEQAKISEISCCRARPFQFGRRQDRMSRAYQRFRMTCRNLPTLTYVLTHSAMFVDPKPRYMFSCSSTHH